MRSEQIEGDPDTRFILQWIAFNAAYAREYGREETERDRARGFLEVIVSLDRERRIHQTLFERYSGPIRTLVGNRFAFEPFWTALRNHDPGDRWKQAFRHGKSAAFAALLHGDTAKVLGIVFDRLYVVRNQLVHGGAILGTLVPQIIAIMMEHPEQEYGDVLYPAFRVS